MKSTERETRYNSSLHIRAAFIRVFWAIPIEQCFFVKANVSSRHWALPSDLSFSLYNSLQWSALPNLCHWNMSSRVLQMLEAAASQASSTKHTLIKKKEEIIILLSTGTIESSLLKPFPAALRIQCAKQSAGKSFANGGTVTHPSSSFGFHHPSYFPANIEPVAKGFHWTIWYHSAIAPVTIYHPLKTEQHC